MKLATPSSLAASLTGCTVHTQPPHVAGTPSLRAALGSAEPRTRIDLLGVELAVHDSDPGASKPAIVCLHAIGHGGSDFAAFEAAFSARYRVITVDWPGQGASASDHEPASAQRYTTLLTALVARLELSAMILLGNSIGGAVAIRYAHAHPQQVRAVILANPGGLDRNPSGFLPGLFIGHIEKKMRRGADGDPGFGPWFAAFYRKLLITPEATARRDAIVANGYEVAPVLAEAWYSFRQRDSDVRALASALTMPVLVAWARRDAVIRWSRNRAAIAQIPNVQVHFFDAGHAAFLETPVAFQRATENFLTKLEATP